MHISDWSSDVCSADLSSLTHGVIMRLRDITIPMTVGTLIVESLYRRAPRGPMQARCRCVCGREVEIPTARLGVMRYPCPCRSEEHTSELQSLMRISYAVFCLKKKTYLYRSNLDKLSDYNSINSPHTLSNLYQTKYTHYST